MRNWTIVGAAALGALLLLAGLGIPKPPAAAQPPADQANESPPPPPQPPALAPEAETEETEEDEDIVKVEHAALVEYDAARELYYLSGNVIFSHQDVKMYCDEAWYNEADDTARATGHLKIVDPEATITGDLCTADFDAEVATVTGNVTMVTQKKKKESEGEEEKPSKFDEYREKKTTITCPKIVYEYGDDVKKANIFGRVKTVQEDKTAWADHAVYEELADIITLTGNVLVRTEKGEEFRSPEVVIATEDEWMKARDVTGITFRKKKAEE